MKTDKNLFLDFNFPEPVPLVGYLNNITYKSPPFPLLTQPEEIREEMFCDDENLPQHCNGRTVCPCLHRLKVKLNSIVEIVLVDENHVFNRNALLSHPLICMGMNFLSLALVTEPRLQ